MGKRIPIIFSAIFTMVLIAWTLSARAQFVMVQANPDESCAVTFNESGQVNIGTYIDGTCHLPEWDYMGSVLLVVGSDFNVVADGPQNNCGLVILDSVSNVALKDSNFNGALFGGIQVSSGSNITLSSLSFQATTNDDWVVGRSLDIQGAQGVTASKLRFKGDFDRANIASSSDVSVERSSFEVSDAVTFSSINIFESSDVWFNKIAVTGGGGGVVLFNATGVSLSQSTITLGADSSTDSILAFDSTGVDVNQVTIDRRAVGTSSACINLNNVSDAMIANSKCFSDPANNTNWAIVLTQVSDYQVTRNLLDGSSTGIFVNGAGNAADPFDSGGEISRNTINVTGAYGIFLSAVSGLRVSRNNVTSTLGTGLTGLWYYDELTDGTQLILDFERNNYSGFQVNSECNTLTMFCP